MKIYYDIEQQSPEWHEIKRGKMSASHADAIGNCGKGLKTYIRNIVKGLILPIDQYTNDDMDRGNRLEPIARAAYEYEYGVTVNQVGFVEYNEFIGCSPDGLIGYKEGGLELKARNDDIHLGLLMGDPVDSKTIWQMNMCMLICEAKWWDFGSFNENYKNSLFVKRFYPDEDKFKKLPKGFEMGENLLREALKNKFILDELKK